MKQPSCCPEVLQNTMPGQKADRFILPVATEEKYTTPFFYSPPFTSYLVIRKGLLVFMPDDEQFGLSIFGLRHLLSRLRIFSTTILMKNIYLFLICLFMGMQSVFAQSPGGVSGVSVWYKANAGVTGTPVVTWSDQSGNGKTLTPVNNPPALNTGSTGTPASMFNFNPSVTTDPFNNGWGNGPYLKSTDYTRADFVTGASSSSTTAYTVYRIKPGGGGTPTICLTSNVCSGPTYTYSGNSFNGFTIIDGMYSSLVSPLPDDGGDLLMGHIASAATTAANVKTYVSGTLAPQTNSGSFSVNSVTQLLVGTFPCGGVNVSDIAEIVVYNSDKTINRNAIESYLGIKYGFTLGSTASPVSYTSGTGTTTWAADATYQNYVAGIGRDDASGLIQKQSQSGGGTRGEQLVMSLGTLAADNAANSNNFSSNNQFFVWGQDNGSLSNVATGNTTYSQRFARVWKTQNTGSFAQGVTVYYPVSLFAGAAAANIALLYGASATALSNGTATAIPQSGTTNIYGNSYYKFTVPAAEVANLKFFSFTTFMVAPGGIAGPGVWLKADAGVTGSTIVSSWADQSANGFSFGITNPSATGSDVTLNSINFNPSLNFSGPTGKVLGRTALPATAFTSVAPGPNSQFIVYKAGPAQSGFTKINYGSNSLGSGGLFSTGYSSQAGFWITGNQSPLPIAANTPGTVYMADMVTPGTGGTVAINGTTGAANGAGGSISGTDFYVGTIRNSVGSPYRGTTDAISEIIIYPTDQTANRIRIESYLALKYGITLSQATATDYIASDGSTKMWNAATAGIFNNRIFGIGKDSVSGLNQQVSAEQTTIDATAGLLTIATTNDFTSANNNAARNLPLADLNFITISDDGKPIAGTFSNKPATATSILQRNWKLQSNSSGSVYFQFNANNTGNAFPALIGTQYYALVYTTSGSADYSNAGNSTIVTLTKNGSLWTTTTAVSIPNNAIFTIAVMSPPVSPAGVAGAGIWLKANAGITTTAGVVASWTEQVNLMDLTNTKAGFGTAPSAVAATMNFNPTVTFKNNVLSTNTGEIPQSKVLGGNGGTNMLSSHFVVYRNKIPTFLSFIDWYGNSANPPTTISASQQPSMLVSGNRYGPVPSVSANECLLMSATSKAATITSYLYGRSIGDSTTQPGALPGDSKFFVGSAPGDIGPFYANADIAEIIAYPIDVTQSSATARNQVESYLALKYGISLTQFPSTQDYIASDGVTKMWDAAAAGPFNTNIFGIGRDDNSPLLQKISASQNARGITTVALDNDFVSNNEAASRNTTFATDKSFFTISDNTGVPGNPTWVTSSAPAGKALLSFNWKVQTNVAGGQPVFLQFDVSNTNFDVPAPLSGTNYYLVYDNSGTFSASSTVVPLVNGSGSLWSLSSAISFSNGARFALATDMDPLMPGTTAPNQTICAGSVPSTPLAETVAATGGCGAYTYNWQYSTDNGTTWTDDLTQTASSYNFTSSINVQTLYRRKIYDACGIAALAAPDTIFVSTPQGDPTVYGNGVWNAYAYDANGAAFASAIYHGYYTEPSLSFNSASRWNPSGAPSSASGYQGCAVNADNHWVSYRRTNFTPGMYQLDIAGHDDDVFVFINGTQVFSHIGSGDTHPNAWTGYLAPTDKVEFLWREYTLQSQGALTVTPLLAPGTTGPSQRICEGTVPATMLDETSAPTGPCAISNYQWQISTNNGSNWTSIAGASSKTYTITNTISAQTLYRRLVTDACGNTIATVPDTIYINLAPVLTTSADTIICPRKSVTVSASATGATIMWTDLGPNNSYVVTPATSTSYAIIATGANGCETTRTVNVTVDPANASLTANPTPAKAATDLTLTAGGPPGFSVLAWKPSASFSNQTAITQTLIILDTSYYAVVIKSQKGCLDTASLKIIPDPNDKDFFMPNAFTPNGDGNNDIYKPFGRSIKEIELRVFNQWGQLLFETKDPASGWNGYYKNVLQPSGPYIYSVRVKLYSGKEFSKKAPFNLVR